MKYKVELDSLFSALRYCATADNNTDFWKRWDRLKVTEQLEALANVTFFDDWQTNEQREFSLYRAEKANAECREIDELLAPFWDNTPETTESRYLLGQWADIQIRILGEMHELREYVRATKEPKQATTPEPATEPEQGSEPEQDNNKPHATAWLKEVFGNDTDLIEDFLREVQNKLERNPTQKAKALLSTFIRYKPQWYKHKSNNALAEQLELCTGVRLIPQNFSHYKEDLEKFPKTDK